jgi:hypothetical protein
MAGAKQLVTLILSWFRPGAVHPAVVCSGHYIALHRGARRGGLQVRRERKSGLRVLEVLTEASANIVGKAESMQMIAICRPPWLGDCPSFYRPRREQFTSMPHCSSYVWRHGVQCHGVGGRPGESRFWHGVMACPVRLQERLRGGWCRGCSFEGRPREDSRVSHCRLLPQRRAW